METRIALIRIIVTDNQISSDLNTLLSGYADYIIGRMGIPNQKHNEHEVAIISIAIEAPQSVISALSGKLGMLNGVTAKVLYAG